MAKGTDGAAQYRVDGLAAAVGRARLDLPQSLEGQCFAAPKLLVYAYGLEHGLGTLDELLFRLGLFEQ